MLTLCFYTESNESVTTATALKDQALAPAALRLPPGKLFFGYPVIPVKSKDSEDSKDGAKVIHILTNYNMICI